MAQQEVLDVLKRCNRAMTRTEIAIELNQDKILISHSIARLIKAKEIKIIELDRNQAMQYKCNRRIRLYYV